VVPLKADSFGFKNAWVAFKTDDPAAVAKALSLRNPRPSSWAEGVAAAYEYPECSVFVTPPIDGWVLCVGFVLTAGVDASPPTFGDDAAAWAKTLGCEVQYFATHRVVEAHAWARARPSGLERAYSFLGESGEKRLDVGPPTSEEQQLGFAFFDPTSAAAAADAYWARQDLTFPNERHVMALAGRWSLDPSTLDQRDIEVGEGLIGDYVELPAPPPPVVESPSKPWWKVW
jgi:hypothetical protein